VGKSRIASSSTDPLEGGEAMGGYLACNEIRGSIVSERRTNIDLNLDSIPELVLPSRTV
jgi:hypothetical protein